MICIYDNKKDSLSPSANCDKLSDKGSGVSAFDNFNTTSPAFQAVVAPLLGYGRENAIHVDQLSSLLGISDSRYTRELVSREREQGILILSGNEGYYLPSEEKEQAHDEMLSCYRRLLGKATSSFPFLRMLESKLKVSPFQLEIEP